MVERSFGVPGTSLKGARFGAAALLMGTFGEQRVAQLPDELVARRADSQGYQGVRLAGSLGDIDHVVLSRVGMDCQVEQWRSHLGIREVSGATPTEGPGPA